MATLNEKLRQLQQAQQEFFNYVGISRRLTNGEMSEVDTIHYKHGSGNNDIPTAYPDVLDYRAQQWVESYTDRNAAEEIWVKLDNSEEWEPENYVAFHILTIWQQEGMVLAVCSHLPKPAELEYVHAEEVPKVEAGGVFYGDECLLLLDPAIGFRKK